MTVSDDELKNIRRQLKSALVLIERAIDCPKEERTPTRVDKRGNKGVPLTRKQPTE